MRSRSRILTAFGRSRRRGWTGSSPSPKVSDVSWKAEDLHVRWFEDGALNVAANCIDRHLARRGNQTAIIWEGDDPKDSKHITYRQLA